MRLCICFFSFILFCGFSNPHLHFEVLKKSEKVFTERYSGEEFHLLSNSIDSTKSVFIAQVKLKGEDITIFDLYARLRDESQILGANSFQIINKSKGGDNYYLLCTVFLTDTGTLKALKKNDPDNGNVFIISPEPVGYLNKDRVRINESLTFKIISGTYWSMPIKETREDLRIRSKKINCKVSVSNHEVKYFATRFHNPRNRPVAKKYPDIDPTNGGVTVRVPLNTTELRGKGKLKNDDGSLEAALGKMMLQFCKSVAVK